MMTQSNNNTASQIPTSGGGGALENTIYISDKAKAKVVQLMTDAGIANEPSYFLRVGVVGGGCSGLSYKLDFDNEA
ncbi:MAG TPA: hypothetical protein VHQ93_09980, partial [Chitinophagaceae bacterium]|nr:hypothetical protein [Chitinophagaceae bacterium]